MTNLSRIGFINKLSGYKGEVLCILENMSLENCAQQKFLFIELDGIPVPFEVDEMKEKSGNAILKLHDVADEAYAKRFLGKDVFADVVGDADDYIDWDDVMDYEVMDETNGSLGKIILIEDFPQQLLATSLKGDKEIMFPLHQNFLKSIDDDAKIIYMDLPEGLVDLYLKGK